MATLRRSSRAKALNRLTNSVFLLPLLLILAVFLIFPLVSGLLISFHRTNGMSTGEFVYLENYAEALFRDGIFGQALRNTLIFTAGAIVLQTGTGLFLAILISEVHRGRLIYRMVFFGPVVLSMVAVGFVWLWIYAPYFGILSNVLNALGVAEIYYGVLGGQNTALAGIMGAFLWRWSGFNTVIYLAGMQSISNEYYEAARIDGANGFQRFWYITWPLLLPQTYIIVLLTTMGTLKIFDFMWIMTEGGPNHATETVATYIYVTAFRFFRVGYGSAMAFILFAVVLIVTLLEVRVLRRRVDEHTR